jgi:thiol-disulfide isomerase/thioredoxin
VCAGAHAQSAAPNRAALFRAAGIVMFNKTLPVADYDFPVTLLEGTTKNLSAYKGNLVLLNFWASWCGPCRIEMPSMQTLYQRYKNRPFAFVALNLGETKETVRRFVDKQKINFPVALDEYEEAGFIYGVEAIPTSYLIDRAGNVVGGVQGSIRWDTPAVFALFDYLLTE